jgi:hypothetical protein
MSRPTLELVSLDESDYGTAMTVRLGVGDVMIDVNVFDDIDGRGFNIRAPDGRPLRQTQREGRR